ncbi:TLDC1 [Bugula neritina]|uniref:TLDC1 n=1 Tax=Bugula neritina TaxID=10212 RepID=A0A7J7JJN8_BUGNE|nr:TLDC1 [Bugula neritina]
MTHTRPSGSARVTEASFYTVIAHLVSCRTDKRAHIIYTLASSTPESGLSAKELFNFVKIVISSYFDLLNIHKKLDSRLWTLPVRVSYSELDLLTYFSLNDLFYPDRKARLSSKTVQSIPDAVYSEEDLLKWCGQPSLFPACFTSTFQTLFPVCDEPERSLLPIFFGKKGMEDHTNLLRVGDVITINQSIPQKLREKWTLLFDSRKHGESFTNLLRNVRKHRNTVLVVRDIEGHILVDSARQFGQIMQHFKAR